MNLNLPHDITIPLLLLLLTLSPQVSKCQRTITEISDSLETILSTPHTTENDLLNLITLIGEYATEKAREPENWGIAEKKVLNQVTAAVVSRLLIKWSKDNPQQDKLPEIQSEINSIEQNSINLAMYITRENSRLESELGKLVEMEETLSAQIANLKAAINSRNSSLEDPHSVVLRNSQILTLNLVHLYACAASPLKRFLDIKESKQISNALLFMEKPQSDDSYFLHPDAKGLCNLTGTFSQFFTSISRIIEVRPDFNQTAHARYHNLGNFTPTSTVTLEKFRNIFTLAYRLEQSMKILMDILKSEPNMENYYLAASFYELQDPKSATFHIGAVDTDKTLQETERLRDLRLQLYNETLSAIHRSLQINETDDVDHIIKHATDQISTATCNLPFTKINKNSELTYYKYMKQLSDIMSNLNANQASRVQIQDPHLKTLSTLSTQMIKSSILQILYNRLLKREQNPLPPVQKTHTSSLKSYTLKLTKSDSCSPDNYIQYCYLINGQYPGPPIIVKQHDFLRVTVINRLPVPTAIHFHGILQTHTVSSDGVPHVTQDLIKPNNTYVYEMYIGEQTGTYMYHGHEGLDLVWLHGALIVKDNPEEWKSLGPSFAYDHEHTFILEEIFHESFDHLIKGILEEGIDDPPVTSFAINGKSYGNWSSNQGSAAGYEVFTVSPRETYRFRVINMAAGSMLLFTIEGHNMTVIEMDGIVTEPAVTHRLELHTGQRYSVLVKMNSVPGNYWVQARLMGDEAGPDNGRAIIHYECAEQVGDMRIQGFSANSEPYEITGDSWIYDDLMPNREYRQKVVYDFPVMSDRQVLIDMQMRTADGPPRFLINGHLFRKPNMTFLESVRSGDELSGETHVYLLKEGTVVDLIFQNRVDDTGGCDEHPIHLHGHSFWVVTSGADVVDMTEIQSKLSQTPGNRRQFRDTFTLFPNMTLESKVIGTPCGWAAVRFVADNPGLWLVHCHVTSHMILGKMFVLYEYSERNRRLVNE